MTQVKDSTKHLVGYTFKIVSSPFFQLVERRVNMAGENASLADLGPPVAVSTPVLDRILETLSANISYMQGFSAEKKVQEYVALAVNILLQIIVLCLESALHVSSRK